MPKKLNIDLENRLILAPMAEVSDAPMRKIAKKFGAGLTFTQMVSADGIVKGNFDSLKYVTFSREETPIAVQILGNDPEIIRDSVKELRKLSPSLIDLNSGCPVPKVTSNQMGSALLNEPRLIGKLIRAMSDAARDIPVSVKLRLGDNDRKINIIENIKIAEDNGASAVIIHAKTRGDSYASAARWEWIKTAKEHSNITVIGNGAVFSFSDALKMQNFSGCDAVMVGRGALGNPFIFSDYLNYCEDKVKPESPSIDQICSVALEHLKLIFREYGIILGLDKAKKNIIWYFKRFNGIEYLIKEILPLKNAEEIENLINTHKQNLEKNIYPKSDLEQIEKKFKERVLFWLD